MLPKSTLDPYLILFTCLVHIALKASLQPQIVGIINPASLVSGQGLNDVG